MKIILSLTLCLCIIGCISSNPNRTDKATITKEEAVNIAQREVDKRGWKFNYEVEVEISWSITPWDKYYPQDKDYYNSIPYYSKINKKLLNRKYWSIYFRPKNHLAKGGANCFFIDAITGEIIDVYSGS